MNKDEEFHWGDRYKPHKDVPPEKAAKELRRIWRKNGQQLRARDVVDESVSPKAPLHPCFTWDDPAAADNWRLHEARNLIRTVEIERDGKREPLFHHVRVTIDNQAASFYQERSVLRERPDEYQMALSEATAYLEGATKRWNALMTLARMRGKSREQQEKMALLHEALATAANLAVQIQ